jgi:hypothetical protein
VGRHAEQGSGLRAADGEVKAYTQIGLPVQEMHIPESVLRITRRKGRGIETEHPAVFPVALSEFLVRAHMDEGEVVFELFDPAYARLGVPSPPRCGRVSATGSLIRSPLDGWIGWPSGEAGCPLTGEGRVDGRHC